MTAAAVGEIAASGTPEYLGAALALALLSGLFLILLGLLRLGFLASLLSHPVISGFITAAGLLIAAGAWQLTPLKQACLRHCRSPLQFLSTRWRNGSGGAFVMGIQHGTYCVGCCWFLMALLFYGGVMNLYWIIGLALFVLLEKNIPAGHWIGRGTGFVLIAWGVVVLARGLLV